MVEIELRYLWTETGAPRTWRFDGVDERELRSLLERLDEHRADLDSRTAVLVARDETGGLLGAWNRAGAAELRVLIDAVPHEPAWLDMRHALFDGVTGP